MKNKFSIAMSLAMIVAMLVTSFALADNVVNDVTVSNPSGVTLIAGDVSSTATVGFKVVATGGDLDANCNIDSGESLTIAISTPIGVTASPASLTFTSCGGFVPVTFSAGASGVSGNVSVSISSNSTGTGTYNLTPASFPITVTAPPPPANTPPSVSVTGVADGASYSKGLVPAATCEITDAEDGDSSFPATLSAISGPYASDGIGSQTASCFYEDAGGLTDTDSATYSIVDPTPPSISWVIDPESPDGNHGWYKSNVTITWTVDELESPSSLVKTGCVDQNITADQAPVLYSCSATSAGGSAGPAELQIKRDATAPTISASASPAANGAGWNNTNVTVSYSCDDGSGSGVDTNPPASDLDDDLLSASGTATGICADMAGNSASDSYTAQIDKVAPTASASAAPAPNANGWNNTNVTVSFSGLDSLSGIDSCDPAVVLNSEGAGQSASGTCTDLAGNVSAPAAASGINIDKTPPVVAVTGVANGAVYTLGSVPAAGCSTADGLSGVATSASLSFSGGPVGDITATCNGALDKADNSGSASVTYHVNYNWNGFFQPIDNDKLNVSKAGSAIPVKFSLSGNQGLNIFAVGYPKSVKISCDTSVLTDEIETTVTAGGSSLSYDALADQYVYVWKTEKSWVGTCRQLQVMLNDGTLHTANFKFK